MKLQITNPKLQTNYKLQITNCKPYGSWSLLLIKSFCGGPGGGFYKKSPLVAEGQKVK